jgi:predicted dithiol-disulfide oxidoreductase (DUF899 family)
MPSDARPTAHRVVSRDEWIAARKALLGKEKELTHLRDSINAERRALPWVKVEKRYVFDTPQGKKTLAELFDGRSQLIVQHFMLGPGWKAGCPGCSFLADHVDGARRHFEHHDVKFVAVSRAPLAEIEAYRRRMGWGFDWVSSYGSDFNYDFQVSATKDQIAAGKVTYNYEPSKDPGEEMPGLSVFQQDQNGDVFHTYSTYARGGEELIGAFMFLDLTPKGRNEKATMDWVRRHDEYGDADRSRVSASR